MLIASTINSNKSGNETKSVINNNYNKAIVGMAVSSSPTCLTSHVVYTTIHHPPTQNEDLILCSFHPLNNLGQM
jgi:hypothetical protein